MSQWTQGARDVRRWFRVDMRGLAPRVGAAQTDRDQAGIACNLPGGNLTADNPPLRWGQAALRLRGSQGLAIASLPQSGKGGDERQPLAGEGRSSRWQPATTQASDRGHGLHPKLGGARRTSSGPA